MTVLVSVTYAEGEEELAEQLSQPIRQAGYDVSLLTGTDLPLTSTSGLVICGTAKAHETGCITNLLGSLNGRQELHVYFVQMERDFPLHSYSRENAFHYWLNPSTATLQLVSALKRDLPIQRGGLPQRSQVFISYSRKDIRWLNRLQVHLKPLERHGKIVRWDDTLIDPGAKWRQKIREAIDVAKVAVLLVSADFLASDFITSNELPPLLLAAETNGALIIPVIISPCRFEQTEILSQFQSINSPSQPLIKLAKGRQEDIFVRITEAIDRALHDRK